MTACTKEIYWYYYITVSVVTYFGGLLILIPARFCWYALHRRRDFRQHERNKSFNCFSRIRALAAGILSGHTKTSKGMIIFMWLVNMAAALLYLTEATEFNRDQCGEVVQDPTQQTSLAFNCLFIVHYVIRFTAAPDKLYMWADIYSIVDHFTIGPAFVGLFFNRNWLGLRFLRLLYLLQIPDILQLTHIVKSRNSIRIVQVASIFGAIWLASSGFVHIIENNGDPFNNYENGQTLTYWMCVYWLLVTMSTVGFGEISPSTDLGRAFIVIFIMGSFAMFSTIIPELARAFGRNAKYHKPYKRTYGKKHIIVCGHITTESVKHFIRNFIHEDSNPDNVDVVFVNRNKPGLEMEAFFKRHFNDVKFVQGTVMDLKILEAVKLHCADACLIIANRAAVDPDVEDAGNVMRATAVKNYNPKIRIILQLLHYRNKLNLLHIPNWRWQSDGDDVICIAELKNGILAQNCMAPGASTLLSNLFTSRSAKRTNTSKWEDLYKEGAGNEIYVEELSEAFVGMSFTQVASICMRELNILLVAVNVREKNGKMKLKVNPGRNLTITSDMAGFFFAQSRHVAKKATHYKGNVDGRRNSRYEPPTLVINGKVSTEDLSDASQRPCLPSTSSDDDTYLEYLETVGSRLAHHSDSNPAVMLHMNPAESGDREVLDITGMFHWCPARPLEQCLLDKADARDHMFKDHIIVCLNANKDSAESGLINFLLPLRSSCLKMNQLKDIIFVTDPSYIEKEWKELANFPNIYVLAQSRNKRADLGALNITKCSMCVIMSTGGHIDVDETIIDNEAILTTLTIKSMFGMTLERRIQAFGVLTNPEAFRKEAGMSDEVPTITELEYDYNVVYVDPDDEDDPSLPIYLTAPFACGKAFVTNVLDSLLSCTYLNRAVLTLARALITGGETAEFEKILSEGLNIVRKNTLIDVSSARPKCRLAQLSLASGPLEKLQHNYVYGELFHQTMYTYDILCLGLYRLMHPESKDPRDRKRVVLCNPRYDLKLYPSDRVFVLQPYDLKYSGPGACDCSSYDDPETKKDSSMLFSLGGVEDKQQTSKL